MVRDPLRSKSKLALTYMSEWNRLNRLSLEELTRLSKRNLNDYFNRVPINNKYNKLYDRIRQARNLSRYSNKNIAVQRGMSYISAYNARSGMTAMRNKRQPSSSEIKRYENSVRLYNSILARRAKQRKDALNRLIKAARTLWYKPGVGRGYKRYWNSMRQRKGGTNFI